MDGSALARRLIAAAGERVDRLIAAHGYTPTLATILVGEDPASATYVRMKARRCEEARIRSVRIELPRETSTERLVDEITALVRGSKASGDVSGRTEETIVRSDGAGSPIGHVDGILLQHPVPKHIDERAAFEAIPLERDVDGVTASSLGRVALGLPAFGACTPAGVMRLLAEYGVSPAGMSAVVIGRSPILGRPMAAMLTNADATVTLCHSKTRDLAEIVGRADLVVAAVGKAEFLRGEWIRPGAVVIDAGYNVGNVGDVEFGAAAERASLITPVPGGVGPMTIATLIEHTVTSAERYVERCKKGIAAQR